jgi:serine/threonine protein kinase
MANRRTSASIDADSTLIKDVQFVDGSCFDKSDADATRRVAPPPFSHNSSASAAVLRVDESFMGCVLEERIASSGMEADIFRTRRDERQYILKLYHYNAVPKKEILEKMREISEQFPECVVRIYECGQESASGRWYELQEYIRNGSLRDLMPDISQNLSTNSSIALTFVGRIVREIAEALIVLHAKDIMHCDLKPANILIRDLEPLDLVLTDFGISSMLDPEASSRVTGIKGSPMYQAPETFAGHVTRSVDWWALGCILCETLLGRHPFSGLNPNEIMLKLVQKGIDLTGLDFSSPPLRDFELLLKGLLTQDYQKRWGGEEVCRWLDGERDIPVYYLNTQQTEKLTPYTAGERVYYEIRELLASFTENEEAWKRGREALYRGELEIWLASNRREEDRKKVTEVKNRCIDQKDRQDAGLFELIYTYNPQLPFCFCGIKINATNLCFLCGKQVRKELLTQAETGVVKAISDGTLLLLVTQMQDNELEAVLELLKNAGTPERQWACLQAVFKAPGEYYCDGNQFTVLITQNRPSPPQNQPRPLENTGGDAEVHRRSQEPSSDVDKETALLGHVRNGLGNFGAAVKKVIFDIMILFSIIVPSAIMAPSRAAGERAFDILAFILTGAGIGSIIFAIRRTKGHPGFMLGVLGCLGAFFGAEVIMLSFGAPSGVGIILILMGTGIDGIISVIRRIIIRRRE